MPNIVNDKSFEDILHDIQIDLMPIFIDKLCKITKPQVFSKLIKALPEDVQELFIEGAILSKQKGIKTNTEIRQLILEYFVNYIHQVENIWVSDRLNDGETLRCLEEDGWKDCDEKYDEKLKDSAVQRKSILEQNPWGYYGKYNPEKNQFNIVNVKEQIKKQKEDLDAKIKQLDELVEEGKITEEDKEEHLETFKKDARGIYSGKNCKNWGKPILQKIAITVLKLDYPRDFKKNVSESKMREDVRKINSKEFLYKEGELDSLPIEDIKRIIFWTSKENKIQELCIGIREWFAKTKWEGFDMLIPDKQAGTYGHKKKEKEEDKKIIIPKNSPDDFNKYLKEIEKLMDECFSIKKYKPDIDSKKWIFIFRRKKLVGIITIDTKNVIWNVCVAKNYRRQGIAKKALDYAILKICPVHPKLFVDNRGKTYTKLIKMYTEYGFSIISNDGKTTTMEFKCKS